MNKELRSLALWCVAVGLNLGVAFSAFLRRDYLALFVLLSLAAMAARDAWQSACAISSALNAKRAAPATRFTLEA